MKGQILYCSVGYQTKILCSYSEIPTNSLENIIDGIVQNVPNTEGKQQTKYQRYSFCSCVDRGFFTICFTDDNFPLRQSFCFLDEVGKTFTEEYSSAAIISAQQNEMRGFSMSIKSIMQKFNNYDNHDLNKIKQDMNETQEILENNITIMAERGAKLDDIEDQTNDLLSNAQTFKKSAVSLKRAMCIKNLKLYLIGVGVLLLLLFVIVLIACGGFTFSNCVPDSN